jgi:micrococcal nuclease
MDFYRYKAVVVSVYDGDTVRLDIDLGFNTWLHNQPVRLYGINTPELRGSERERGLEVRDALRARIMNKAIVLESHKDRTGKYGRYLGTLWDGDENINGWLLDEGMAEPYL